jgi:tetratricopeptide (TPR) repeat protein
MIFAFTWVMSAVLFIAQMAKRGVFKARRDDWLVATALYMLVSLTIGFGFAMVLGGRHAALVQARPETVDGLLNLAGRVAGVLTVYYGLILFTLIVGGAVLLIGTGGRLKPVGQLSVIALLVLLVLAGAAAVVTNLNPIKADIIYKQADPYERQDQWPVAIRHYNRAIDLAPREDFYYLYLGRAYLEYAKRLEDPAQRRTVLVETEETLREAREINPLNTDHSANLARMYRTWAQLATDAETRQEMIQRSSENYEIATRLSPSNAILWNEWALLYLTTGRFEEAQEKLIQSLEIDNAFDQTWTIQADLLANQDMITDALGAYKESLFINQRQNDVWLRVGDLQREQENYVDAARAYEQALALNENQVQVWRILSVVYTELGSPGEAILALEQALALDPEHEGAWDSHRMLAYMYAQVDETERAQSHAEQALSMVPEDRRPQLEDFLAQVQLLPEGSDGGEP